MSGSSTRTMCSNRRCSIRTWPCPDRVIALLFEVFGGWSPEVEALFQEAIEVRSNRLTAREYEETTWSARTWYSFAKQQVSVALHRAVAWEIGGALRIAARAGADPRGAYVAGG